MTQGSPTRLQYVLIPHPDDEFEAWSLIGGQPELYPVFILLTHGEATGMCLGSGLREDLGERVPQPQPFTGPHTPNCAAQRLDSWHTFLDAMAGIDDTLDVPTRVDPQPDGFELFVGERSARAVFDGGDGTLTAEYVTQALAQVRRTRGTLLPALDEGDVLGAAYYNRDYPGAAIYLHADHRAVHVALFHTDQQVPGAQYGRTAHSDPDASPPNGRIAEVDPSVYEQAMAVAPDGQRSGLLQVIYGWLGIGPGDGRWPAGETDAGGAFSRQQVFWRRFAGPEQPSVR